MEGIGEVGMVEVEYNSTLLEDNCFVGMKG